MTHLTIRTMRPDEISLAELGRDLGLEQTKRIAARQAKHFSRRKPSDVLTAIRSP
jgi:hypothetical protein